MQWRDVYKISSESTFATPHKHIIVYFFTYSSKCHFINSSFVTNFMYFDVVDSSSFMMHTYSAYYVGKYLIMKTQILRQHNKVGKVLKRACLMLNECYSSGIFHFLCQSFLKRIIITITHVCKVCKVHWLGGYCDDGTYM